MKIIVFILSVLVAPILPLLAAVCVCAFCFDILDLDMDIDIDVVVAFVLFALVQVAWIMAIPSILMVQL